jgi:hypothetical protein
LQLFRVLTIVQVFKAKNGIKIKGAYNFNNKQLKFALLSVLVSLRKRHELSNNAFNRLRGGELRK